MILFCNKFCFQKLDNSKVCNLSSSMDYPYDIILNLYPRFPMSHDIEQFDKQYFEWIIGNDVPFMELMKIMMPIYNGIHVIVCIGVGELYDFIAQSLQKLIQQRYGINSYNVYSMEDYEGIQYNKDYFANFNIQGVYNMDIDRNRFVNLIGENEQLINQIMGVKEQIIYE